MTASIRASGGVIDKYIGDAIMAYWGPPFVDPEAQARAACEAAFTSCRRSTPFAQKYRRSWGGVATCRTSTSGSG
jgi:adenylate cyclase